MIAKGKQTALLNDKFGRAASLVLFFFFPGNIVVKPFAVVTGTWPVEFPFKVFVPGNLPGVKLLLAQKPLPHELIHQPIVEINAHRRLSGPVVRVVVSDGGIIGGPYLAGIADKLKQTDGAGAVLVQPEERPHEVLGTARLNRIEVLAVYPQGLGNLVQQLPLGHTVIRFVLGNTVIRSLFLKADSQPQFLLRHTPKCADFLDFFSYCHMFHRL